MFLILVGILLVGAGFFAAFGGGIMLIPAGFVVMALGGDLLRMEHKVEEIARSTRAALPVVEPTPKLPA